MTEQVLVVWFDSRHGGRRDDLPFPDIEKTELLGESLWRPKSQPFFVWAIDGLITTTDERWAVFGPYSDHVAARAAFDRLEAAAGAHGVLGYRIFPSHGLPSSHRKRALYTDG